MFLAYDKSLGGLQFVEKVPWVPSLGINYFNAVDGFSLPNLLLTGIVFFTGVLTMWELETRVKEYFALYFLLVTGVFGLFMSMDLFFIFVWYDVSLFPMYLLIAVWGTTRKEYGAMKLTLYLLAGSALILPAVIFLCAKSGMNTFSFVSLMQPGLFSPGVAEVRLYTSLFRIWDSCRRLAFAYLVAGRTCRRAHWSQHGACGRSDENRRLRGASGGHHALPPGMDLLGKAHGRACRNRDNLRGACRFEADRSEVRDRIFQRISHGGGRPGPGHGHRRRSERRGVSRCLLTAL